MKNNYKIVIIDDDELAVDNLAFELKSYQQFNVEGIAKNGAMGKKLIFKTMPDLVFLDVELPDMQGPELLNLVRNEITWNMQVVFYTAYNKYMLDAIRESAFDYLLKPIDKSELSNMMKRFHRKGGGTAIADSSLSYPVKEPFTAGADDHHPVTDKRSAVPQARKRRLFQIQFRQEAMGSVPEQCVSPHRHP